ncbi:MULTISPECIES: electron transfer flavoprotein subunit alpha/FixB family protein [Pseudomonas]|uniref:electron transfer flavoprotein subunit alpha/FixB family protein n=1 Tax=Pseudomonas TaxID=286 RepID=UPI001EE7C5B1|nr:FAD-binding protein [Pseudomonas putida]
MKALILADYTHDYALSPATLSTVTAAKQIGADIDILVAGSGAQLVAEAASQVPGISSVLFANDSAYDNLIAEAVAPLLSELAQQYSYVLSAATTNGKNILPRVAALLDVDQISEITSVESPDTFKRSVYAGNAIATVQSFAPIHVLTVRPTSFEPASSEGGSAPVTTIGIAHPSAISKFVDESVATSDRPELATAKIVISGGRGMQNGDNFKILYSVADKLGAAVGASRAAVDSGFVPNDMQVGQTGKIVAPNLYLAVGISGAIQHLAGMKDSKVIVAINSDPDAPIFQVADYGLVADLFEAVPELERAL